MLITKGKDSTIEDDKWNQNCSRNYCKYKRKQIKNAKLIEHETLQPNATAKLFSSRP